MGHFLEKLEDRTLLSGSYPVSIGDTNGLAKSVSFTDGDGTVATISVKGGSAEFDFNGTNVGYVALAKAVTGTDLSLAGITLTNTTDKSSITITTKNGTTPGITLDDLEGTNHSLGTLSAATTNLEGSGITIAGGYIGKLTLASVNNTGITMTGAVASKGVSISIGGIGLCIITSDSPVSGLTCGSLDTAGLIAPSVGKVVVNGVANGSSLSTGDIVSIQAVAWNLGQINADTLGTLKITGQKASHGAAAVPGDFTAEVTLTGPVVAAVQHATKAVKPTLGTATVAGNWGADGTIAGLVNSLTVGHLQATLDVTGSVKSFKTSDPMALTPPNGGAIGGLAVSGSAVVTAGKQKLSFTNGQLFTSTNQMYRLADLWQLDGGYDQTFSGKAKGGGSSGSATFELTTDSNGNLSALDGDTGEQMFGMAWTADGEQIGMDDLDDSAAGLGDCSFTFSNPLTVPEYLEMGKTFTDTSTVHGDFSLDVPHYGTVDLTLDGNINMSVLLADHENVTVGDQSVLAAKVQFGLSMSGTFTATVDGQDISGKWKINQQMQLYSTPDGGPIRVAMKLSVSASAAGQGVSANASIDATVDDMPV